MRDHDLDAPNLDTMREPHGRSRLFLEDDPPILVEDDASMSVGPSPTNRPSTASAVFLFVFVVAAGVTGALAWRSYGDQAMDMIRTWALSSATTAPPEGFAELQQQLKSLTVDLAAVRHTLEQFVANQDQLTRKQEEMAHKQEQMTKPSRHCRRPSRTSLRKLHRHPRPTSQSTFQRQSSGNSRPTFRPRICPSRNKSHRHNHCYRQNSELLR
jgi:hypothetical protein